MYIWIALGILILFFWSVSSAIAQSSDLESTLEKAQKFLDTRKTENGSKPSQAEETGTSDSEFKVYENLTYGLKVKYPSNWTPTSNVLDRKSSPEIIFDLSFFSPFENEIDSTSVSIRISVLDAKTTLEEYKDQIVGNMENSYPDIKEIITSKDILAGKSGYRIESLTNMIDHWEKSIDLYNVENGTLYEVSVLGKPEHIKKYSEEIKSIIGSVEFKQPQANFQQVSQIQLSNIEKSTSQPKSIYINDKCGVSIMLPKGWTATESDFVFKDQSKTLANFQSQDDDIFDLTLDIQNIGYSTMSPTDTIDVLRDYATLLPDSKIIESSIGQISGFPSYKIVYSEPGEKYEFYTYDNMIIAYDREYRLAYEAADRAEFDKYRSTVEEMAKSIKITQPDYEGINC